ncbi:MAG TPA: hypothetical protein VGL71_00990 [Urbifossiella sp.]
MYSQMKKLALGFRLVFIGMLMIVLASLGSILGLCITSGLVFGAAGGGNGGGVAGAAGLMLILMAGMFLLIIGGAITTLIGEFFCLAVPDEAGAAKGMIFCAVGMELASIGIMITMFTTNALQIALEPIISLALAGGFLICYLGSIIFFLLFTRTVAEFVDRRDLADTAMSVLWLWAMTIGLTVTSSVVMGFGGVLAGGGGLKGMAVMGCVGLLISLVSLILGLINFFRFMALMRDMSEASLEYASGVKPRRTRKPKRKKKRRVEEDEDDEDDDDDDEEDERWRRNRDRFRF